MISARLDSSVSPLSFHSYTLHSLIHSISPPAMASLYAGTFVDAPTSAGLRVRRNHLLGNYAPSRCSTTLTTLKPSLNKATSHTLLPFRSPPPRHFSPHALRLPNSVITPFSFLLTQTSTSMLPSISTPGRALTCLFLNGSRDMLIKLKRELIQTSS